MARLIHGAETSISMAFLVMCAEKILRLLSLFFVLISAWLKSLLWLFAPRGTLLTLLASDARDLAMFT